MVLLTDMMMTRCAYTLLIRISHGLDVTACSSVLPRLLHRDKFLPRSYTVHRWTMQLSDVLVTSCTL